MAACGSLQHMFENPLPESPTTLLGSLSSSWNQIKKSTNPIEDHPSSSSSTDLFGELHFQDNSHHHQPFQPSNLPIIPSSSFSSSPSSSLAHLNPNNNNNNNERTTAKKPDYCYHKNSDSFSSMNSESLQLCTEGLGFESSDDVEDLSNNDYCWRQGQEEIISVTRHNTTTTPHHENHHLGSDFRRSRIGSGRTFPPPISSIGQGGKPWACFKSYRRNGRFILEEIRVPTREFLHACREDGRLKLQLVQSDDETLDEEDGEEEEEEEQVNEENEDEEEEEEEKKNSDDNQEDGDRDY